MATAARKVNWFAIWTTIIVAVVVIGVGATVVTINAVSSSGGTPPQSANVNAETGAIAVGTGPRQVDTYIDFMCPVCKQFETTYGETLDAAVADGSITLNVHPIAILDNLSQGTKYSTRAASAAYCVVETDPMAFPGFVKAMYGAQPAESSTGLTNDEIAAIATSAGATNAASCIQDMKYSTFVTAKTKLTPLQPGQTRPSTPTLVIDGEIVQRTGDPAVDVEARIK